MSDIKPPVPPYCVIVTSYRDDEGKAFDDVYNGVYRWQVDPQANLLLLSFADRIQVLPMDGIASWTVESDRVLEVAN